jgi:hypothetical protein
MALGRVLFDAREREEATMDPTPPRSWSERSTKTKPAFRRDRESLAKPTFERHYTIEELAEIWGMSVDFVRRLFLREPGVLVFWQQQPGRRVYRTLRIPESVAERVHRRMTKP